MLKAGTKVLGNAAQVLVIADHQGHLHRQLTGPRAPEQIQQAVVLLADEDRHPRQLIGEVQLPFTAEPSRQGLNRRRQAGAG